MVWSTVLDPLIVQAGRSFRLDEDYVAGWLSHFPGAPMTPFVGVNAVRLPVVSKSQTERSGHEILGLPPSPHDSLPDGQGLRRALSDPPEDLGTATLRFDAPILANLAVEWTPRQSFAWRTSWSHLAANQRPESNCFVLRRWRACLDERPYIAVIEKMRGQAGCDIDVSTHTLLSYRYDSQCAELTPVSRTVSSESIEHLPRCIATNGNRIFCPGLLETRFSRVPKLIPQLADLFVAGRLVALTKHLRAWALVSGTTAIALLVEVRAPSFRQVCSRSERREPGSVETGQICRRAPGSLFRVPSPIFFVSRQAKLPGKTGDLGRSATPGRHRRANTPMLYEKRYPYLDRDLVEFLFAVPRSNFNVRVSDDLSCPCTGSIVPDQFLKRKRKAFIARQPLLDIMSHCLLIRTDRQFDPGPSKRILTCCSILEHAKAGEISLLLPLLARAVVLEKAGCVTLIAWVC